MDRVPFLFNFSLHAVRVCFDVSLGPLKQMHVSIVRFITVYGRNDDTVPSLGIKVSDHTGSLQGSGWMAKRIGVLISVSTQECLALGNFCFSLRKEITALIS